MKSNSSARRRIVAPAIRDVLLDRNRPGHPEVRSDTRMSHHMRSLCMNRTTRNRCTTAAGKLCASMETTSTACSTATIPRTAVTGIVAPAHRDALLDRACAGHPEVRSDTRMSRRGVRKAGHGGYGGTRSVGRGIVDGLKFQMFSLRACHPVFCVRRLRW